MPVTVLVTTPGSAAANAYISRAAADQYHLDHPQYGTDAASGLWSAATNDQKDSAILWATKLLDRFFVWKGSVVDTTQKLLWPRAGLIDVNDWQPLDRFSIPDQIQWAVAEFARQLIVDERTADSDIETFGIKLLRISTIRIDFWDDVHAKVIPDIVSYLIPESWGYVRENGEVPLERA